jgi:hypothetical protein
MDAANSTHPGFGVQALQVPAFTGAAQQLQTQETADK